MNVGIGNKAAQFSFWDCINWIFDTVWLCLAMQTSLQHRQRSDIQAEHSFTERTHSYRIKENCYTERPHSYGTGSLLLIQTKQQIYKQSSADTQTEHSHKNKAQLYMYIQTEHSYK
jgi:hypothetical protein